MKKKLLIAGIVLVLLFQFAGCRTIGKAIGKALKDTENTTEGASEDSSDDWYYPDVDAEPRDFADGNEKTSLDGDAVFFYKAHNYDSYWGEDCTYSYLNMEWVVVEPGENYSKLAEAVNGEMTDYVSSKLEDYDRLKGEAEAMYEEGWEMGPLYIEITPIVSRADSSVFSFWNRYEDYTGGAHGYYGVWGYNYDSQTGRKLDWRDCFNLTDAEMEDLLIKRLEEEYPDYLDEFFDYKKTIHDEVVNFTDEYGNTSELNFYVDNLGVTFVFNPYELAAFAAGTQEIFLSYEEYGYLMDPKVTTLPESYCIRFYDPLEYDVTGDGKKDTIQVEGVDDYGYGYYDSVEVAINGNRQMIECYGFEVRPLLVVRPEGCQLIINTTAENDWIYNVVLSIGKDGSITKLDSFDGDIGDMLNPDCFLLNRRFDLLSTYSAYAPASLDKNGVVQSLSGLYEITGGLSIVSTADLELPSLVTSGGAESGSNVVIPAGSEFFFEYTDGLNTVFFNVEGYGPVKITIQDDPDNWCGTVNGIPAQECFENLFFAG